MPPERCDPVAVQPPDSRRTWCRQRVLPSQAPSVTCRKRVMAADERPGSAGASSFEGSPAPVEDAVARDAVAASTGAERHGIEQHGIDLIPAEHRRGRPRDLLWFWMGVTLNIEFLLFGGLLPAVGLSFWQSVLAIALGNLAWFITGATSLQGPRTGTANLTITRAAFGNRGGRLIAIFCWLSLVTYETMDWRSSCWVPWRCLARWASRAQRP